MGVKKGIYCILTLSQIYSLNLRENFSSGKSDKYWLGDKNVPQW